MDILYIPDKQLTFLRGAEMPKKKFLIAMDEKDHAVLKQRAKTLNLNIGQMVEDLLASMEVRLRKAYKIAGLTPARDRRDELDRKFMKLIFEHDQDGTLESVRKDEHLNEVRLIDEISTTTKEMCSNANATEWMPMIEATHVKFRGASIRKDGRGASYWEENVTPEDEKAIYEEMKRLRKKAADDE